MHIEIKIFAHAEQFKIAYYVIGNSHWSLNSLIDFSSAIFIFSKKFVLFFILLLMLILIILLCNAIIKDISSTYFPKQIPMFFQYRLAKSFCLSTSFSCKPSIFILSFWNLGILSHECPLPFKSLPLFYPILPITFTWIVKLSSWPSHSSSHMSSYLKSLFSNIKKTNSLSDVHVNLKPVCTFPLMG